MSLSYYIIYTHIHIYIPIIHICCFIYQSISRTAVGMYDYIQEAIAKGQVLLEWDYSKGEKPPVPLVKDKYASERRKAKTLNFSIAYGKTVHGLAEDWGITKEEAEKTLEAWYRDRPGE